MLFLEKLKQRKSYLHSNFDLNGKRERKAKRFLSLLKMKEKKNTFLLQSVGDERKTGGKG
jgi:hypothetical protein